MQPPAEGEGSSAARAVTPHCVDTINEAAARVRPSVVRVEQRRGTVTASGAGVIVDASGLIVIAAHVVETGAAVTVYPAGARRGLASVVLNRDRAELMVCLATARIEARQPQPEKPITDVLTRRLDKLAERRRNALPREPQRHQRSG